MGIEEEKLLINLIMVAHFVFRQFMTTAGVTRLEHNFTIEIKIISQLGKNRRMTEFKAVSLSTYPHP